MSISLHPKLVVFDFDGVFTQGDIQFDQNGAPLKSYNVKDGYGIKMLQSHGIKCNVLSGFPTNDSTIHICNHLKIDNISLGNQDKLKTLTQWANELDITLNQVAYIGDDINDLECLETVGISACPADAHKKCKKIANYICESRGGNGAIREFAEYILHKVPKLKTISALVCVKLKSTRCQYKNIRRFGNTTLIEKKLDKLLELQFLEYVVFNTDSLELIQYIKSKYNNPRLKIVQRDSFYASDHVENKDFCINVTTNFPSEYVLYSPVTMPFIKSNTYKDMYNQLNEGVYDSIILAADGKQGKGHSIETHHICFAASMISVTDVQKYGDFIGEHPFFQSCNLKERMDIDYPEEFNTALYHEFNKDAIYGKEHFKEVSIYDMHELKYFDQNIDMINEKTHDKLNNYQPIQIIDVTTRDGGFVNKWSFTIQDVEDMMQCASDTGIDFFEIGYLMNQDICNPQDGIWRNVDFETIKNIVNKVKPKCKISAMIDYWRYDINKLPPKTDTDIDLIRVTCYMDKLQEAIDYCQKIHQLGYDVSLNVMCGSYFNKKIVSNIIEKTIQYSHILSYLYIADTYGAMNPHQIRWIYSAIVPRMHDVGIKVGFHIHNNGQIAMANTLEAIEQGVDIVDASYSGMGRGAGNLLLEYIILYLDSHIKYGNRMLNCKFDIKTFLTYIQKVNANDEKYLEDIKYAIVGFFNAHPYRLRDFDDDIDLYTLYQAFESMPVGKKYDYLLG